MFIGNKHGAYENWSHPTFTRYVFPNRCVGFDLICLNSIQNVYTSAAGNRNTIWYPNLMWKFYDELWTLLHPLRRTSLKSLSLTAMRGVIFLLRAGQELTDSSLFSPRLKKTVFPGPLFRNSIWRWTHFGFLGCSCRSFACVLPQISGSPKYVGYVCFWIAHSDMCQIES